MNEIPVIAIFDVGKTNKKLFLFDEQYRIIFERTARFTETMDEDGAPCENLESLRLSVFDSLREVFSRKDVVIKAINFSTYGASLVYIDEEGRPLTPLYNYLKEYPAALSEQFYHNYGGEAAFSVQTASPVLGSLNSGMQLYRLKYEKPEIFAQIKYALHLPQYMSYLLSGVPCSDMTSIGCHTNFWDFKQNNYHPWVIKEGVLEKLAPLYSSGDVMPAAFPGNNYAVGTGLHDSSAALIPYLVNFHEPFVLISTGTWCISLNPFNDTPLTPEELAADCLCYLSFQGKPVKASRLFAGYEHEQQVKRIAAHFNQHTGRYRSVEYDGNIIRLLRERNKQDTPPPAAEKGTLQVSLFGQRNLDSFASDIEAYHQLVLDIANQQYIATSRVLKGAAVKRIFVDGGFSKNVIYMNLLAALFPDIEIFAASMAQATAMGAALAIHHAWNSKKMPNDLIELKYYSVTHDATL
ncbi:FGGY-family carbohydrate kinase [Chitinophaga arvensicola]|uniref:Sugar (Pentulose or hexulose) kinase n=1 Tax=Chitinophaga arvensicola TaxID=29529 RepID=A0A1I0S6C0_9BACT|nr:FGGY family carbohydrate kinase [Chitinophaga arvensicola]SEW51005.1 Sugar (pentulose or hexulose) kinase [Chitinophaga arvensicola]